jgi:metal-sulfur cluster biosynthetic enzyme
MNEHIKIEEVDSVEAPPKVRVESAAETLDRKKDYLEGFLAQKPVAVAGGEVGGDLYEAVISALKEIYDLGLIYNVEINDGQALVSMTLTTPNCPVAESMPGEVEMRVAGVPGILDAEVVLVWEPAWSPANMTDEARLELGML